MGKLRNIIWSGYNGGFWGRASRKGRKIFKKFIVISHVKLKNLITLQKFHECADLVKNIIIIIIKNSFLTWAWGKPPKACNLLVFS